jgi:hypothetical protein
MYRSLVDNGTLREDETREIDETLTRVARRDLVAVGALRRAGLTVSLRNIGVTSYEFERLSPVGEASQSMSILDLGERDLVTFAKTSIPIPVTASQFRLDARHRAAGDTRGEPVSLTNVEEHTRSVSEKLEDTLVNGAGAGITVGGNTMPGFTNFASREQLSHSGGTWDSATDIGSAVTDVIAMRTALQNNGFTGPYVLAIPGNYLGVIEEDYSTVKGDRTLRQRLLAIDGISEVTVWPALADSEVLLIQMTRSVVTAAIGQDITTVTWDEYGGLAGNWAILAVMGFALRAAAARAPLRNGVLPALTTAAGIAHLA